MFPNVLSALKSIHEVIKGDTEHIILFKNGTYLLLNKEQSMEDALSTVGELDPGKFQSINLHFFKSHTIVLFVQIEFPQIGYLKVYPKSKNISMDTERKFAKVVMSVDMKKKEIVVDSRETNLLNFQPTMYFVVNHDLKMGKGKIAAQVGHAVETLVEELVQKPTQVYTDWKESLRKKVVLKASEEEIKNLLSEYGNKTDQQSLGDCNCISVMDAGLTQVEKNSLTVIGFVPMYRVMAPEKLTTLKLL